MEDGTLVFSLMAMNEKDETLPMLVYSTDDEKWLLSEGVTSLGCRYPRVTKWEGSVLMIVDCEDGQRVYESCDMGTTWTEAIGTLPGVWVNARSGASLGGNLYVDALITATIGKREVMLYTQRGHASREMGRATALYLWVTDNNRSFSVGPVATEDDGNWMLASTLLYSEDSLHLLQQRGVYESDVISLSRLTEELKEIKSVLSTWVQKDNFLSGFSIPTAGLVAVLSNASANNNTWNDEYLCLNAMVTNARKVEDGLQLTETDSGVIWLVNGWNRDNVRHVSLSYNFTLLASVTIEEAPSGNTPLLAAMLDDTNAHYFMGLSYTADKTWETMFERNTTTHSSTWEPKKEYQVVLMLQGSKASVYIDGVPLREEEEVPLTGEKPLELVHFCFGACDIYDDGFYYGDVTSLEEPSPKRRDQNSPMTVKNVFLYNRPLNSTEMSAIKDRIPVPTRGPESQLEGVPQTLAPAVSAVSGRGETPEAPGRLTSAWNEGTARETGDAGSVYGNGLLPLLLLLGLWGLAAA
ncbi:trans-sialidase, putative [Trypanosoma cruzi marinkellei]|uniref:Trans-sialidase, putative n=1 Tax=Trypanosoma cruzi marinkellei TaxID=85056 RepID=K2MRJ4_TRYCR|nr:trans-sialidase, putative [Trypanosoma cruzi marinkellei]